MKEFLKPSNGKVLVFLIIIIFALFSYVNTISTYGAMGNLVYTQQTRIIGSIRTMGLLWIFSDVTKILHPNDTLDPETKQNVSGIFNSSAHNLFESTREFNEEFREELEGFTKTPNFRMNYLSSIILFPTWSYELYLRREDFSSDLHKFDFIKSLSPNILHGGFSIIYWYLIACLIVFGYCKLKKSGKKR